MMKKNKGLLLLLLIIIVLFIVYMAMKWRNEQKEKSEIEKQEASVIHVTESPADKMTLIKINVGNGEMELSKEDDIWYYTADYDFPVNQDCPQKLAEAVGDITADRILEDGDSLQDYGLEKPEYYICYTDEEGNTTTVYFGNTTGEYYYVKTDDSDQVYTVENTVLDSFSYTLDDIAQLDEYPSIGSGNLKKEVIIQNGETTVYDSENEDQTEDIAAVAGGLGAVTLSEAADYSAEEQDLAGFGLDETNRITVQVTYTENDEEQLMLLYIGNADGAGNKYVMMNDSKIVYLISEEICDNILNI